MSDEAGDASDGRFAGLEAAVDVAADPQAPLASRQDAIVRSAESCHCAAIVDEGLAHLRDLQSRGICSAIR